MDTIETPSISQSSKSQDNQASQDLEVLYRIAHDMLTPVTNSLMMVDLIRLGGKSQNICEYWDILQYELGRQKRLVDTLLQAGRIQRGKLSVNIVTLDILQMMETVLQSHLPEISKKGISLLKDLSLDLPLCLGDELGVSQIIHNLLDNAIKYTPSEGTITVKIWHPTSSDQIHFSITDTGIGIPTSEISSLFTPYFRASNAESNQINGNGLGLFICQSILKKMNGEISVQSLLGHGSTFEVTLPSTHLTSLR